MRKWVFRIPKASGGEPDSSCPTLLNEAAIKTGITGKTHHITNYDGCLTFVLNELFVYGRLRQGWAVPTLDLRLPIDAWIENYRIASNRYWDSTTDCQGASGRRKILLQMVDMAIGDVIFLPNVGNNMLDHGQFTVVTVKSRYYFEDRSQNPNTWEKDFAHIVEVDKIKTYPYSPNTLQSSIFGAPYLCAVNEIKSHFQTYNTFEQFVKSNY